MRELISPPKTDAAFDVAYTINLTADNGLKNFAESIKEGFRLFWYHPLLTPSDIAEKFGTNCCKLFDRHAESVSFLLSMGVHIDAADYTPPQPFIRNIDGTITIE